MPCVYCRRHCLLLAVACLRLLLVIGRLIPFQGPWYLRRSISAAVVARCRPHPSCTSKIAHLQGKPAIVARRMEIHRTAWSVCKWCERRCSRSWTRLEHVQIEASSLEGCPSKRKSSLRAEAKYRNSSLVGQATMRVCFVMRLGPCCENPVKCAMMSGRSNVLTCSKHKANSRAALKPISEDGKHTDPDRWVGRQLPEQLPEQVPEPHPHQILVATASSQHLRYFRDREAGP